MEKQQWLRISVQGGLGSRASWCAFREIASKNAYLIISHRDHTSCCLKHACAVNNVECLNVCHFIERREAVQHIKLISNTFTPGRSLPVTFM